MSNNTTKAKVAPVQLGKDLVIEGLRLPDGTYAIANRQIADLISASPQYTSKLMKRSLRKGSELNTNFLKIKTDRNNARTNSNPETVLTIEEFSLAMTELAFNGNEEARVIVRALNNLSLRQLFADSFGEEMGADDRQEYLTETLEHKKHFKDYLTDWLKDDGVEGGKQYAIEVDRFKRNAGCPKKSIKEYTPEELRQLNTAHGQYHILRKTGMNHTDASIQIAQSHVPVGDINLDF